MAGWIAAAIAEARARRAAGEDVRAWRVAATTTPGEARARLGLDARGGALARTRLARLRLELLARRHGPG